VLGGDSFVTSPRQEEVTLLNAQLALAALGELRADERDAAAELLADLASRP